LLEQYPCNSHVIEHAEKNNAIYQIYNHIMVVQEVENLICDKHVLKEYFNQHYSYLYELIIGGSVNTLHVIVLFRN